jgi:hypothetical protein
MAKELVLDKAAILPIIIAEKHSFNVELKLWADRQKTEPILLTGTWNLSISSSVGGSVKLSLTEGDGLTIVENIITIDRTVILNTLNAGKYFYDLRNDNGPNSLKLLKGDFIVNPSIAE